ncbi:MAG: hypothetical protein ACJ73S_15865 [Mycobacteriales bacterium]
MSSLDNLKKDDLVAIFTEIAGSKLTGSAQAWENFSKGILGTVDGASGDSPPTSLKAMGAELRDGWRGVGADAFTNKMNKVGAWAADYAGLVGGGAQAVSGILSTVADAQKVAVNDYHDATAKWTAFKTGAAAYFTQLLSTKGSVAATGQGSMVGPPQMSTGSNGSGPTLVTNVMYTQNGFLAEANLVQQGTASQITLLKGQAWDSGHQFGQNVTKSGNVSDADVETANVDQYMTLLRGYLHTLGQTYAKAANSFPAKMTPLSTQLNNGGGGSPSQYPVSSGGGVPVGTNVPVNKNGSNVPVNNGVNNGQNGPLTSANGAVNPLTSANGANGSNVPLSQSGVTPTSLASAPVTTPTGLNSGLNSGVPTGTAGLGSIPPVNGISGGLPGLANTGPGLPMFVPPVAGGVVPNSEFGSGLPGEFGGAGGNGLSEDALDGGLANGEFGANGELNPGATGALGEGALAAEVAPGAAASELGAAARGAPMMPFMPMSPMMGGSDGGERRRTAWLDEDEDIWAADADPAPAVIGGGEQ